jgi:hypothetical protein
MPARRGGAGALYSNWFGRDARHASPHALVAAATQVRLNDRKGARRQRMMRQGWQESAWAMHDSIGEVRYATNFLANCASRMRLYVAAYPRGGESDTPLPLDEAIRADPGIPSNLLSVCAQAISELGDGKLAVANMLKVLSSNMSVAGEAWLLGQQEPQSGEGIWSVRSIDEIVVRENAQSDYSLREAPTDPQGVLGLVSLDPMTTTLSRMWLPHPRFRILADSPMRAILDDCDSLLILRRMIRAEGRSRLAGAGLLAIPEELQIKAATDDNEEPEADPFLGLLTRAMMTPIEEEGSAAAVVPILIRGPGAAIEKIKFFRFSPQFDALAGQVRGELVGVIATGMDLPKEVVMGMADINHWGQWQIDTSTFRYHVEPHVVSLCDCLTGAYLRPYLLAAGIAPQWSQRILFWYDPTELVTHPDRAQDAKDLYGAMAISAEALRDSAGFTDADAPTLAELEARRLYDIRALPLNLLLEYARRADPSLVVPPITVAGTVPGIKQGGVDVGVPALPAPAGGPAGSAAGQVPVSAPVSSPASSVGQPVKGPPPVTAAAASPPPNLRDSLGGDAPACGRCRMFTVDQTCWGYGNLPVSPMWVCDSFEKDVEPDPLIAAAKPVVNERLSRKLVEIDRDLRTRLQTAANAAMLRQLERAGAQVRTRVMKGTKSVPANETLRTRIAHRRNERVPAIVGRDAVVAMGLPDLIGPEWETLRDQFMGWTKAAQRSALTIALRIGNLDAGSDAVVAAQAAMDAGRATGWQTLSSAMTALAHHLLYSPDPNTPAGDWGDLDPNTIVPTGVIRTALGVAGGATDANGVSLIPEFAPGTTEFATIPVGAPIGQIGTGSTVQGLITAGGGQVAAYRWDHGMPVRPFPPHEELDGTEFLHFDDPVLRNDSGWPANEYYAVGDHSGCGCDVMPIYVDAAAAAG